MTTQTFFLHVERVAARSYVEALALPVSDAPPHVRELVREGQISTKRPVRSVVFVDDGRYFRLDHDGVTPCEGALNVLPWLFGLLGAGLVGFWLLRTRRPLNR